MTTLGLAVTLAAAAASTAASKDLLTADGAWRDGLLHKDKAALEKVVAPEYTLTTAMGITPREQWMKMSAIWETKALGWVEPPRVQMYGDSAVLSGKLRWHVIKDKPDARTGTAEVDQVFLVTDVWVRREGHWQVVARHSTLPLAPAGSSGAR